MSAATLPALEGKGPELYAQVADTPQLRAAASALITRQYAAAGYGEHALPENANSESLVVLLGPEVVGTLTITFDSQAGLMVDQAYLGYVRDRRRMARRCAEITKLAFDAPGKSMLPIDAGFRLAVDIMARRGCTDVFAEVHPDQVNIYRRRFGFWPVGHETTTERVKAPARLLWTEMEMLRERADRRDRPRE